MLRSIFIFFLLYAPVLAWAQQYPDEQVNQLVSAEYNMGILASKKGVFTAYKTFSDDQSIFFTPSPTPASDFFKNKPEIPDVMTWKPVYAKVAKSNEWGFTTGSISWQRVGYKKKYGEYFCLWKRDRKGEWKIAYRAISEHGVPKENAPALFFSPENNKFYKLRSQARLKQREDLLFSTDQLFSTILKADNPTAFSEFMTDYSRIYLPGYTPVVELDHIKPFLKKQNILIESTPDQVDRCYSGELAYSQGEATIRQGDQVTNCYYIRVWEVQEDAKWKVSVDMYIAK